jgi:DNA repair protein RadC
MKIQHWAREERPREKILQKGGSFLSEAELIAVLFGTGMPGLNCLDWARQQLANLGGVKGLFGLTAAELIELPGVGMARAAQILAVREILNRIVRAPLSNKQIIRDPEALSDYLRLSLGSERKEKFRVFFLNKRLELLHEQDLFTGTIDETPVYPREVIEMALTHRATALILAHNHPSGRLQPSPEDIQITDKLVAACSLVGIRILDHVIVSSEGYFSFSSEGVLSGAKKLNAKN